MTVKDSQSLARTAQFMVVELRRGHGSPPTYDSTWQPVWGAKIDRIEINRDNKPSVATIWFPELRWQQSYNIATGDMIRIRTDEPGSGSWTVLFEGFVTNFMSDFSGGSDQSPGFERQAIVICDYRWLLSTTSPIFGQFARTADDTSSTATWLSGRRAIFNADGRPNCDATFVTYSGYGDIPVFADPDVAIPWTAYDMLTYVLGPYCNSSTLYFELPHPDNISVLSHTDWDKVLNHVVIDGLNVIEAMSAICRQIGWGFREDYTVSGPELTFYKIAGATGYVRNSDNPVILHELHAPAVGDDIDTAVGEGKKMLWSMTLAEDIAAVVNNPWGLGSPDRFEFTAELVPAFLDTDLIPDTSESNTHLFFIEADLQEMTDPDSESYYKYYHPRGSLFIRNVGRRWSLNEAGRYGSADTYDRGMPFDFSTVVPAQYILNSQGHHLFAPFNRRLLPCLTADEDSLSSVGIKVEFSFDGGSTWQVIPANIVALKDECGIYIEETNLAELVDHKQGTISGGDLDGVQLNLWTSLCDDILNSRSFKNGQWKTRVRVTASVQLDRRLTLQSLPTPTSGSPFHHRQIYDFSDRYGRQQRTSSSSYAGSSLPAWQVDSTTVFDKHLQAIRDANEDMSISGQFTLERLWLGDGSGLPDFMIGDCIEKITGRSYRLSAALGSGTVYPEIVQIIYLPDKQQTKLITRDLRFAEVVL